MTPQQAFDKLCLIQQNSDTIFYITNFDSSDYFHLKGDLDKHTIQMILRQQPVSYAFHSEFGDERTFCVSWKK